jgi:hypothetical protein
MNWAVYVDVAVGFVLAAVVLTLAIVSGRQAPVHRVVWIVGLVLLSLRTLFSVAIGTGVLIASSGMWAFALGALALVLLIPTAYLRPRWAGIVLLVTAVLQPALLLALRPLAGERDEFPVEVMLGFYSLTAIVIGGVLIASTLGRAPSTADSAAIADSVEGAERQR